MSRWKIESCRRDDRLADRISALHGDAPYSIVWYADKDETHKDDIEMAGRLVSEIVSYGCESGVLSLCHHPVFPTLRTRPNNTHASFQTDIPERLIPRPDGAAERLVRVRIDGVLTIDTVSDWAEIEHICFPADAVRASFELVTIRNTSDAVRTLSSSARTGEAAHTLGPMGIDIIWTESDFTETTLAPGESYTYYIAFRGGIANEPVAAVDPAAELARRRCRAAELMAPMLLDTGSDVIDTMFAFAKLRAGESVFDTRYGPVHSPGGTAFYAATWCNDQVEYAGPYFAYTGDERLLEASMNAYRMYIPFMSDHYDPIPSSVIAEGLDFWNGAGDRGDAAMYLFGASRFVMTSGRRDWALELLPAIEWCAEYCRRRINEDGVIASDSDELEGRFPSGDANLCTSALAYDGYNSAAMIESVFGNPEKAAEYELLAAGLEKAIERHFGAKVGGYHTYRYFEGCEKLRSWICMPLCVGMDARARGTVAALCDDRMMRPDGVLTEEGSLTIWDRSTLYTLRGIFAAGETDKACGLFERYSENRLLGERVPYAVEAYPEGGRRHLSGESALYCKVIIEGILAMRPAGFDCFTIKPVLPAAMDHLYLRGIHAYGGVFDILVGHDGFEVRNYNGDMLASGRNGEETLVMLKDTLNNPGFHGKKA